MKKRNVFQKILVVVCTSTMFLSVMTASAAGAHDGRLTDRVTHSDLKFEEYTYDRMDIADFDAIIDGLDELTADAANADQVLDVIIAMEDFYCEASRCYSIAHIHSDLVADDAYWDDEVMFWDELTTDLIDKIMLSYKTIAVSPNADVLKERVDDEDEWQDILDYEEMTQEQKDLNAKDTELSLQYDILYNKEYTTKIGGKQYNAEELEEAAGNGSIDNDTYQKAYVDLMSQANQERAELYLELVEVRTALARSYGYDNYAEYAYEKRYGRDYSSSELKGYRDDVKNHIVSLQEDLIMELYGNHYRDLQDMFDQEMSEQDCLDTLRKYLPEISNDLLTALDYMEEHHLYDLSVSDAKAPGGYTTSISVYNAPYIYNCADGTIQDMETLIHEYGHYNQMYHMTEDSWYYDKTDLDLAEIHSQGLELLFMEYADDIYGQYADVMKLYTLFNLTYATVEGVKEDAFQYAVYSDPDDLTVEKLNQIYYDCCMEYSGQFGPVFNESISYGQQGYLPADQCYEWVNIPHTFQSPMYYISYSVSAAAVFELLDVNLDDRDEGIETYLALVDAEFQEGFQDTLNTVGLNNPIKNPRFELYADDIRYALGLVDERTVASQYEPHQPTTYWGADGGSTVTEPGKEDPEGKEETDTPEETDTDEEDASAQDYEKQIQEAVSRMMIAGAIAAVMFLTAIVIIIVVVVKYNKNKKAKQGIPLPKPGAGTNPYLAQQPAQSFMNPVQGNGLNPAQQPPMQSFMNPAQGNGLNMPQQPPISMQGSGNGGTMYSHAANVQQPINPYMQQSAPIIPASSAMQASSETGFGGTGGFSLNGGAERGNGGMPAQQSINPYAQQMQINPYAGQSLQINPYAQQTTPNPYLKNLQAMQQQEQQMEQQMTAGNGGTASFEKTTDGSSEMVKTGNSEGDPNGEGGSGIKI